MDLDEVLNSLLLPLLLTLSTSSSVKARALRMARRVLEELREGARE